MTVLDSPTTGDMIRKLVAIRKGLGLTPKQVATRMQVEPHAVYAIEYRASKDGRDILLGTLVAYMRAIGVRLTYEVVSDIEMQRRSA